MYTVLLLGYCTLVRGPYFKTWRSLKVFSTVVHCVLPGWIFVCMDILSWATSNIITQLVLYIYFSKNDIKIAGFVIRNAFSGTVWAARIKCVRWILIVGRRGKKIFHNVSSQKRLSLSLKCLLFDDQNTPLTLLLTRCTIIYILDSFSSIISPG